MQMNSLIMSRPRAVCLVKRSIRSVGPDVTTVLKLLYDTCRQLTRKSIQETATPASTPPRELEIYTPDSARRFLRRVTGRTEITTSPQINSLHNLRENKCKRETRGFAAAAKINFVSFHRLNLIITCLGEPGGH